MRENIFKVKRKHYLKHSSSFIVVILRSLSHKACVCCNEPIKTYEESETHWRRKLEKDSGIIMVNPNKTETPMNKGQNASRPRDG